MTPAIRIRWRIFSFLFGFGFIAYVQQKTITVAAERMMPELGLTQAQIGWLLQAFVWGYAIFQIPGGVFGQRIGARRTFVVIGLTAFAATIATPLLPHVFSGNTLFFTLLLAQVLLGFSQGAIFPVSGGVFEAWFPPNRWSFVQGLQTMGLSLGAALTPPLIVSLMADMGWQSALLWSSLPALIVIAGWGWYGRDTPGEHPAMTEQERQEIDAGSTLAADRVPSSLNLRRFFALMRDRDVMLLALSYMCMNYTFYLLSNWVFLYLVQERNFSLLESGWLATVPPLAAAVGAGIGGLATSLLCQRFGDRWGYRIMPLLAMPGAGALLLFAVHAGNPYVAVGALAVCFFCVELTEGAYWGGAMTIGGSDTMAVCGVMNTGGNLGGIIGIPIVAYFSGQHHWESAFIIGAVFALVSAVAWLGIHLGSRGGAASPLGPQTAPVGI
jgi:ACS family glucarate transporter-like MFS transporter